jgi:hypothetical protein
MNWTKPKIEAAKRQLQKHATLADALPSVAGAVGGKVTVDTLDKALRMHGEPPARSFLKRIAPHAAARAPQRSEAEQHDRLVELAKKAPSFSKLCDALDLSPSKTKELIASAKAKGIRLRIEHDHVGLGAAEVKDERLQDLRIAPVVGERQMVGVISDLHAGSKFILRDALRDCVAKFYERGVREMLVPGDLLDGVYRHSLFDQSHVGLEEQTKDLFEVLPVLDGLRYLACTGNHCETLASANGVDVGDFVEGYFQKHGRSDLKFYGRRSAYLKLRGAVIHLWHPRGGGAYAVSYPMQKKCEGYSALKPQILLIGHWHKFCWVTTRSIQAVACGTFQGTGGRKGSEFSNSLVGDPAIGGLLLSWNITADGTLREFAVARRAYYENERPVEVNNPQDAEAIEVDDEPARPWRNVRRRGR